MSNTKHKSQRSLIFSSGSGDFKTLHVVFSGAFVKNGYQLKTGQYEESIISFPRSALIVIHKY